MRQAGRRCPKPRTATPTAAAERPGVAAAGSAAVQPSGEVAMPGGHRPHRPSAWPEPSSSGCPPTGPLAQAGGHHGGHLRPSAAIADRRCAARVSHTRCPQRGRRTGRCPPADRPADMAVEAAAEGPQGFRPGGGNGALRHQTWGVTSQPCGSVSLSPSARCSVRWSMTMGQFITLFSSGFPAHTVGCNGCAAAAFSLPGRVGRRPNR
jgi:hypothetical protein